MKRVSLGVLGIAAIIALIVMGPTDAQINERSGTVRFRWAGVPLFFQRIKEPYRAYVQQISTYPDKWIVAAKFPLSSTNNTHFMCQGFYMSAAAFASVDSEVGKAALESVVEYIERTHVSEGLPRAVVLFRYLDRREDGWVIDPKWKDDPLVKEFLSGLSNRGA